MDANSPYYYVGTPGKVPSTKTHREVLAESIVEQLRHTVIFKTNGKSTAIALVRTSDLARDITGYLNEVIRHIKPQDSRSTYKEPIFASELDLDDLLSRACQKAGIPSYQDGQKLTTREHMVSDLARELKVKCTDCGYYPFERVDLGDGYKMQNLTPELEKKFCSAGSKKCPRCGLGRDTNGDGDCAVCGHMTDTEVAQRLRGHDKSDVEMTPRILGRGSHGITVVYESTGPTPPDTVYMNSDGFQHNVKSLAGRILTVFDATLTDPTQREAMKSLIRREVRTQLNRANEFFSQRPIAVDDEEEAITQKV